MTPHQRSQTETPPAYDAHTPWSAPRRRWTRALVAVAAVVLAVVAVCLVVLAVTAIQTLEAVRDVSEQTTAVSAEPAVAEPEAGPTETVAPDPMRSCAVEITTSGGGGHPDRATVACGVQEALTVSGDFRDQVTNRYDPEAARGLERIVVVNGEARVWMGTGQDGSCLIAYAPGGDPVACEVPSEEGSGGAPTGSEEPLSPEGLAEQDA